MDFKSSRKFMLLLVFTAGFFFSFPKQEAKAFDPVTIALLSPIAISFAQKASPYVIKGLMNAGKGMVRVGVDMIDIFRLPLGFFQSTILSPWYFTDGLRNIMWGGIAPFKMTIHMLAVPIMMFGVNI